jgi:hypothetical protein
VNDGFLARWSRRKRDEARRPAEAPPAAPAAEATPLSLAEEAGTLSPEELAQLPSLEALTATTDLAPFLRAGVPRALRNAALRRMWSLDPAIRDFVSEAREYAYDWNTPGGVPGSGGLIPVEEVRAMVERVFGGSGGKEQGAPTEDSPEASSGDASGGSPPPPDRGEDAKGPHGPEGSREGAAPPEPEPSGLPAAGPSVLGAGPPPSTGGLEGPSGILGSSGILGPSGISDAPPLSRSAEGIPRPSPDRREPEPSSPSRLRRHGGALPF